MEQSEFSGSGSKDGATARIAEELSNREKEPPPHRKLEVSEVLRKSRKTQSKHLNMNKLCVPRGTIGGFQIREGRGGGSDFGEVKLRGKEPPPPKTLKFR